AKDALHGYFRQALECADHCRKNLWPADDDYEERCVTALSSFHKFAHYAGEYLHSIRPQDDLVVAPMVVRAVESAVALDPSPKNIAGMANTYYSVGKDYVKAARWYRKALTLPEEESNTIITDAHAYWRHKTILAQLRLPGMPLEGYTIHGAIGEAGPSGQPQAYMCAKFPVDGFGGGPDGMQLLLSLDPPRQYTIPTTDPNDAEVFPPHILEMVQPHLLDEDGED
ncbi:MAG: hypothetical protein SGARI_001667, partial [Bacillariaceae sp.]